MKKTAFLLAVVVCLVFVASICLVQAAAPIRIGAPLLLSGAGAYVGGSSKDTLEMMAADLNKAGGINGRPIEFVFYDEEGKPDVAVNIVKRLIQKDKVHAIIGLSTSWTAAPAIPIIEQNRVPAIILAAATSITDPVKKWIFKTPVDDRTVAARLLMDMQSQGIKRIALVSAHDAFGDSGRSEILAQAPGHGIKVVFDERFTMEDTDITPMLGKIKNTDAQATVNWSSRRSLVVMTNNYRQVGLTLPLYHSGAAMSKDFLDAAGKNANGVKVAAGKMDAGASLADTDAQKKTIMEYRSAYKKKYNKEPNQFGAIAFDAFNIMVAALKKVGADDRAKLRDAVEQTKGYVGVNGVYTYAPADHAGIAKETVVIYQAQDAAWKLVK